MQIGIMGTGRTADIIAQAVAKSREYDLTCIYDTRIDKAQNFAKKYHCGTSTFDPEVVSGSCDMVYISAENSCREELVKKMLDEGKHVLCQAPISMSGKTAEDLYDMASNKGLVLMEATGSLNTPGFMKLTEVLKSGVIGSIVDIEASFSRLIPTNEREHSFPEGGCFETFGNFVLAPVLRLLGTSYKDGRLVGSQHTPWKQLAQTGSEVKGGGMGCRLSAMAQKDIYQSDKRRIAKHLALCQEVAVQSGVVAAHHLTNDGQLGLTGL